MYQILGALCSLSVILAAPPKGWPWEERKHFSVDVMEAGNKFREDVDMDLERGIEIIRVPPHNNIGAVIFVNDYHRNQTMRYLAADNMCFLSTLAQDAVEGSHESLDEVVQDFEIEEVLHTDSEVKVEIGEWRLGELVDDITEIGDVMQRLCAGHDIYRLEMTRDTMHVSHDDAAPQLEEKRRDSDYATEMLDVNCPQQDVRERCKFQWDCSYTPIMKFYTCKIQKYDGKTNRKSTNCRRPRHLQESIRCCRQCCNNKERSGRIFPYCAEMYDEAVSQNRESC